MNPPYGKMPDACRDYSEGNRRLRIPAHYPLTSNDLYAAFIEKAIDLISESGFVGMLTSQTFMYLRSFQKLRTEIIGRMAPPELMLDCEFGVLDGATVATSATILRKRTAITDSHDCLFVRLWHSSEGAKEGGFCSALRSMSKANVDASIYCASLLSFSHLFRAPYCYWMSRSVTSIISKQSPLDRDQVAQPDAPKVADVKQGLDTGSDPRFVRFYWEVDTSTIARNRQDTFGPRVWIPFAKGGWLDKLHADISCVAYWKNDGEEIRGFRSPGGKLISAPRSLDYYCKSGIAWMRSPQMGSILNGQMKRINARWLPEGVVITGKVCGVFPSHEGGDCWRILAIVNSELAYFLVRSYSVREIQVSTVASLPYLEREGSERLGSLGEEAYLLSAVRSTGQETSPFFVQPFILQAVYSPQSLLGLQPSSGHPLSEQFRWPPLEAMSEEDTLHSSPLRETVPHTGKRSDSLRLLGLVSYRRYCQLCDSINRTESTLEQTVYDLFNIGPEDQSSIAREIDLRRKLKPLEASEDNENGDGPEENEVEDVASTSITAMDDGTPDAFIRGEVFHLVSYAVKMVIEKDPDGIIPITLAGSRASLASLVKGQFAEWFGSQDLSTKWTETGEILGKPVEDWLSQDFFNFHVNMYRRRPIFWQLTSAGCIPRGTLPGAFSCLVHYHKLRVNTLQDIVAHYLVDVIETGQAQFNATKTVLEGLQQRAARRRDINDAQGSFQTADRQYRELIEFRRRIQDLDTGARPITPAPGPDAPWLKQKIAEVTGGPAYGRGWLPVLDYGVRVNIEPLKVAGILPRAADRIE